MRGHTVNLDSEYEVHCIRTSRKLELLECRSDTEFESFSLMTVTGNYWNQYTGLSHSNSQAQVVGGIIDPLSCRRVDQR